MVIPTAKIEVTNEIVILLVVLIQLLHLGDHEQLKTVIQSHQHGTVEPTVVTVATMKQNV